MNELILENVSKIYDRNVINNLTYTFEPGKLYIIKGVSGCGKSTLFNIIGGIECDFDGNVIFNGCDSNKGKTVYRKNIGYIYQNSLLLSGVTIIENLLFINNDRETVEDLAKALDIYDLLERLPDELSGGERQRVAILRSLLNNPQILLADEPTASLDASNSMHIAKLIASQKKNNRIILVATHEHCFDCFADEILYLEYGEIKKVEKNKNISDQTSASQSRVFSNSTIKSHKKKKNINLLSFAVKRHRGEYSLSRLLPFSLIVLLILIISTVQNSFEIEYMHYAASKSNSDLVSATETQISLLEETYREHIRLYYPYYAEENGTIACYLADKKDSIFALEGMLIFGEFPKEKNEILISFEYAEDNNYSSDIIGKEITFLNHQFVVAGVTYSYDTPAAGRNADFQTLYRGDYYYRQYHDIDSRANEIYVFHDVLSEFGEIYHGSGAYSELLQFSYPNLFSDMKAVQYFREWINSDRAKILDSVSGEKLDIPPATLNYFDYAALSIQETVDNVTIVLLALFFICFFIFCIFLRMNIDIELFYRRREIGFLRIFGVNHITISKLIIYEYASRLAMSCFGALIIYAVVAGIYITLSGHIVWFNVLHVIIALAGALLFYFITIIVSIITIMRKKIIDLVI